MKNCLNECLLESQDLLNTLTKIMNTCLVFADHVKNFSEACEIVEPDTTSATAANTAAEPGSEASKKTLKRPSSFRLSSSDRDRDSLGSVSSAGHSDKGKSSKAAGNTNAFRQTVARRQAQIQAQTQYILKESKHAAFSRYLTTFETKFDKEVRLFCFAELILIISSH